MGQFPGLKQQICVLSSLTAAVSIFVLSVVRKQVNKSLSKASPLFPRHTEIDCSWEKHEEIAKIQLQS